MNGTVVPPRRGEPTRIVPVRALVAPDVQAALRGLATRCGTTISTYAAQVLELHVHEMGLSDELASSTEKQRPKLTPKHSVFRS